MLSNCKLILVKLTVLVLAEVVIRRLGSLATACLVDGPHAEAVDGALLEPRNLPLTLGVWRVDSLRPLDRELVLDLDGVVGDGTASILVGRRPLEDNHCVVVIDDVRFAWTARFICGQKYDNKYLEFFPNY